MSTPTLSMQLFGQTQREKAAKKARSEAAKKAWQTRKRRAKPSATMNLWLYWLSRNPTHAIVQRFESNLGCMFNFGPYPPGAVTFSSPPEFTRGTFFALRRRGWIREVARTEPHYSGFSILPDGKKVEHHTYCRYWQITDKGRNSRVE